MYVQSSNGKVWRVDRRDPLAVHLSTPDGLRATMPVQWDDQTPVTILEPTHEEALEVLQDRVGAEVLATAEGEGPARKVFKIAKFSTLGQLHHHMFLFHGIHTGSGPGSKSREGTAAAHKLDHEDAVEGKPTGRYMDHEH